MKHSLSLEIKAPAGSPILLEIAAGLQEHRIRPETLVWTEVPGTGEARVWLVIEADAPVAQALVDSFRAHPEIPRVRFMADAPQPDSAEHNPAGVVP